jgi:metal-responsive CopG/Arc/MetJ family transcriptional regulator
MILGGNMKIAISIDDEILREADEEAGRMGLSRSRLLAMAVGEFLRRQRQEQMLRSNDTEPAEKSL